MDAEGLKWWTARQSPCPVCGGASVPVVLDMQDAETYEAVRVGLASLGGCGLGGARNSHQCTQCGTLWSEVAVS